MIVDYTTRFLIHGLNFFLVLGLPGISAGMQPEFMPIVFFNHLLRFQTEQVVPTQPVHQNMMRIPHWFPEPVGRMSLIPRPVDS